MNNENKNNNQNNNKNKHHKRKSYFIAPNEPQKQAQSQIPGDKTNEKKKPNPEINTSKPQEQNKSQNNSKRQKHKGAKGTPNQQQNTQTAQKSGSSPEKQKDSTTQNQQRNQQKSNKQKQNNNHNDNNNKKNNENATLQQATQTSTNANNDFPKNDRLERPEPKKLGSFSSSPEYEKYKDYQEFTYEELYGSDAKEPTTEKALSDTESTKKSESPSIEVVGIKFKSSGKTYYFAPNGATLHVGNHAIVETSRGVEFGEVVMSNSFISEDEIIPPLRPVVRVATNEDVQRNADTKKNEELAFKVCNEKIIAHKLDMKLIDAQYTFDNSKLLFYFTSSGRVDFRELVKDLASVFRTRIELRQIGIRDEAKMIGGLGICGRPLCCSIFLTDFGQVSIKMAKEQSLSLNSAKISGICGRLMCCLRYEHETYEYEIKRTPPVDTLVRTVDGIGTVTETSPLQGTIRVRLAATPEAPPKTYKRDSVTILKLKKKN